MFTALFARSCWWRSIDALSKQCAFLFSSDELLSRLRVLAVPAYTGIYRVARSPTSLLSEEEHRRGSCAGPLTAQKRTPREGGGENRTCPVQHDTSPTCPSLKKDFNALEARSLRVLEAPAHIGIWGARWPRLFSPEEAPHHGHQSQSQWVTWEPSRPQPQLDQLVQEEAREV